MGTTYSNCQVRSDSQDAVVEALRGLLKEPAYVSPAVNGWVGVYPEGVRTDLDKLAKQLSAKLSSGVFSWNVYDSDVFAYSLYENGRLRDKFNSNPDCFEPASQADKVRLRGKPEALVPYCLPGIGYSQVKEVLHPPLLGEDESNGATMPAEKSLKLFSNLLKITSEAMKSEFENKHREKYLFADQQANDLAKLLGIDEDLVICRYRDVAEASGAFADRQFRLVGNESLSQEYKDRKIALDVDLMQHPEKMQEWLEKGANPNAYHHAGITVLFQWAEACFPEQVEILLKAGADVNAETDGQISYERGMTALMAAAGRSYEQPGRITGTVKLLIEAGANVNARTETGRTALSEAIQMTDWQNHRRKLSRRAPEEVLRKLAAWSAEVVEMLREAGATE